MTVSAANTLQLEHDYILQSLKQAGLGMSSIARADRIAVLRPDCRGTACFIGCFSARDINAIKTLPDAITRESQEEFHGNNQVKQGLIPTLPPALP